MTTDKTKQYIYIVQALLEPSKCKIGKTNNLEKKLDDNIKQEVKIVN